MARDNEECGTTPIDDRFVSRSIAEAILSSGFLIVALTGWFYFVATANLEAHIEYYGGKAHWFDPSIGRLASYSIDHMLRAAYLLVPYLLLILCLERRRLSWVIFYCIWVVSLAYWLGLPYLIYWADGNKSGQVSTGIAILLYLVSPQALRTWNARRKRRFNETIGKEIDESLRVLKSTGTDAASQAEKEGAKRRLDEIVAELKRDVSKPHMRLAWTMAVVSYLAIHLFIVQNVARMTAYTERARIVKTLSATSYDEASPVAELLFTDGVSSLVAKRSADKVLIVFENPQAGIKQTLSSTPIDPYPKRQ